MNYIQTYNSYYIFGKGYNMTYGGDGLNGYIYTEEDRKKMSEIKKKQFENPEIIEKCCKSQKKRFENQDERQKRVKKRYIIFKKIQKQEKNIVKKYRNIMKIIHKLNNE
jgi:succinate dehydrogenase/fumarate reductase flavoprotein subunit